MAAVQSMTISPKMTTVHSLDISSPQPGSPPFLSYSPCSVATPSSTTSSPPASLRTASTSLPSSPSSVTTSLDSNDGNGKVIRRQPSRIRRKPAPRLTLEEELALLDDESRRVAEDVIPAPASGFGLLPAFEVVVVSQKNAANATAPANPTIANAPRQMYSVVPDPPAAIMLPNTSKANLHVTLPKIIATAVTTKSVRDKHSSVSPIPPDSPSVSEVAIEWYNTPVLDKDNSKRFRMPSDVARDFGTPSRKVGAPASCRSSMVNSDTSEGDYLEVISAQQSEYDSEDVDDEEKRASIMTDTFGPAQHIRECKTGKCHLAAAESDNSGDEEDGDTGSDAEEGSSGSKEYVSAIPIPISPSAEVLEYEAGDIVSDSIRLSEYRWLPKRFGEHKDGRKQTGQSFSTTTTQRFPRSRSPTFDTESGSFVTATEGLASPSASNAASEFRLHTPRLSDNARLARPFLSTSPSIRSLGSESGLSNAATFTASDGSNERDDSIFDTPSRRASALMQQRKSTFSISSDPIRGTTMTPLSTLPGRKISLSATPPVRRPYTAATMRWDQVNVSERLWTNGVRRPYLKSNPSFIDEFPPPPADYQMNIGKLPQTPKNKKRNFRPSTAPELGIGYTPPPRDQPLPGPNPAGPTPSRRKAFSLVMRELLALHEASIQARHEAARIKAEKKAAAKQALNVYTYKKPEEDDLKLAADCIVYSATGKEVRFGDLYEGARTIVCFIRHYWCPSCQDYLASIMRVEPAQLRALNLQLIIIGCGNWKMIEGYRKALGGCEFPVYSDPSREVYKHFGITMSTMAAGTKPAYTKHGLTTNTLISLRRNLAMPLKNPGDLNGLGGEFVLGPGKTDCAFAHRMKNTRDHAELIDILKAIGMTAPKQLQVQPEPVRRARSAEEIRVDQVQKRAESVRRKRMRAYKPGRIVVTVPENGHGKEISTQTV